MSPLCSILYFTFAIFGFTLQRLRIHIIEELLYRCPQHIRMRVVAIFYIPTKIHIGFPYEHCSHRSDALPYTTCYRTYMISRGICITCFSQFLLFDCIAQLDPPTTVHMRTTDHRVIPVLRLYTREYIHICFQEPKKKTTTLDPVIGLASVSSFLFECTYIILYLYYLSSKSFLIYAKCRVTF